MFVHKSHKIPGYTLSEVLVVLVITAIVVGIAFSVLRLVVFQLHKIETAYTDRTEVAMFKQHLYTEVERAQRLFWNDTELILELESKTGSIIYEMGETVIIRDYDTITFGSIDYKGYLVGKEVTSGPIDAFKFTIKLRGQQVPIFIEKSVDVQQQLTRLWD